MRSDDFFEPRNFRSLVLTGKDFDDISLAQFGVEVAHFAVNFNANHRAANFGMKPISKIQWHRTFGEVNDVALGSVDENFISKKV